MTTYIGLISWWTFPKNIYISWVTTGATNTVFTFTHNLWLIQADVQSWKYKVFVAWFWAPYSYLLWDTYCGAYWWGDVANWYVSTAMTWNAWNPTDAVGIFMQANTTKIRLASSWASITSFVLIIQQLY